MDNHHNPHAMGCAEIRDIDGRKIVRRIILTALIAFLLVIAGMAGWHRFGSYLRGDEPHTITTDGQ